MPGSPTPEWRLMDVEEAGMDRCSDGQEIESRVVLPAGMELVVPPEAGEPAELQAPDRVAGPRGTNGGERAIFPPCVDRGEVRQAPVA